MQSPLADGIDPNVAGANGASVRHDVVVDTLDSLGRSALTLAAAGESCEIAALVREKGARKPA